MNSLFTAMILICQTTDIPNVQNCISVSSTKLFETKQECMHDAGYGAALAISNGWELKNAECFEWKIETAL